MLGLEAQNLPAGNGNGFELSPLLPERTKPVRIGGYGWIRQFPINITEASLGLGEALEEAGVEIGGLPGSRASPSRRGALKVLLRATAG